MCRELGMELDEQQLEEALKDLDLNKDGVVDLDEFKRWYFTGMKPYNGTRRAMLKIGGKVAGLMDVLGEETKNALMAEDLKTMSSSMTLGFNPPKNPKTTINAHIDFGGQKTVHKINQMRAKYMNAIDKPKEKARFEDGSYREARDDHAFLEFRIAMKPGTAKKHAEIVSSHLKEMLDMIPEEESSIYFRPKITAPDDKTVVVGMKIHFPNENYKIPEEFVSILSHAGQCINYKLELGTSIEEVMKSESSLIHCAAKGFRVQHKHTVITNLRHVFMRMMEKEDQAEKIGMAMAFAPVTMLGLSAEINVDLDEIDELEDHPMAEKIMLNFNDVFQMLTRSSHQEVMDATLDLEGIEVEPKSQEDFMVQAAGLHEEITELVNDSRVVSKCSFNVSIPSALASIDIDIDAPGVKTVFHTLLKLVTIPIQNKLDYLK